MKSVEISAIKNIAEYEVERETLRPQMIALKDRRRVRVGDHLTFLFENRDTVRYQIQEMLRIERIVKQHDIEHELETYNELIPGPGELSATLLIEYDSPTERDVWLRALLGLENHVWMQVGSGAPVRARFDDRQIATDRISSVQYVKFAIGLEGAAAFSRGARVFADHPKYAASTALSGPQLAALGADFE